MAAPAMILNLKLLPLCSLEFESVCDTISIWVYTETYDILVPYPLLLSEQTSRKVLCVYHLSWSVTGH